MGTGVEKEIRGAECAGTAIAQASRSRRVIEIQDLTLLHCVQVFAAVVGVNSGRC